jgi:hypothetical protein
MFQLGKGDALLCSQTLGKCAKMIPVMIWGILIMRKRYGLKDFLMALAITGGCTLFLLTGDVKSKVRSLDSRERESRVRREAGYMIARSAHVSLDDGLMCTLPDATTSPPLLGCY